MKLQYLGQFSADITLRVPIFWYQFLFIHLGIEMATNRCFINKQRFGGHGSGPALIGKENASYSVTNAQILAAFVQPFHDSPLFSSQI